MSIDFQLLCALTHFRLTGYTSKVRHCFPLLAACSASVNTGVDSGVERRGFGVWKNNGEAELISGDSATPALAWIFTECNTGPRYLLRPVNSLVAFIQSRTEVLFGLN